MTMTVPAERLRSPSNDEQPVQRRRISVVTRQFRVLSTLTGGAVLLTLIALAFHSGPLLGTAIGVAALGVVYLALIARIAQVKARNELAAAFRTQKDVDDSYWRELAREPSSAWPPPEPVTSSAASVDNSALLLFILAYFLGWGLTPVVALIRLVRGDLSGIEGSPLLGRLVALQRRGRSQSLRLLVAGTATVTVVGGSAATMVIAPQVAAAAGPAYVVHPGDTLAGIAGRYGTSASSLAQLNGIADPNVILPGEVIRLADSQGTGDEVVSGPVYTVQPGDTLGDIAADSGTTVAGLASLNGIADPNVIMVGQTLKLAPSTPTTYTVQAGDTLAHIAARFGTTFTSLAAANNIPDPNFIEVGQVLSLVPSSASSPAPAPVSPVAPTYVNPLAVGSWSFHRIDQGVDWIPNVTSPVVAIGDGVITFSSTDTPGWPGGAFIAYRLSDGSNAGLYIYVAEHLSNLLPVGTAVSAGQQIATALPGYPWSEWGWAAAEGPAPAPSAQYNGAPNGTPTTGGKAFARFLISLGVSGVPFPGPGPTTP